MNNNYDFIFNSNYNKIFSEKDIYIDHDNLNMDLNIGLGDANIKNAFESFDNIFNNKNSRKSSYDENDFQKPIIKPNVITPEINNIFNLSEKKNELIAKERLNKKRKMIKNVEPSKTNREKKNVDDKKIKFNSYKLNPITEEQKKLQKDKNKISARKSRQKKKQYIIELEKENYSLKEYLERIKENSKLSNNIISLNEKEGLFHNKKELCNNCSNIENLKLEESLIINSESIDSKNSINLMNSYTEKQKQILEKMLINQIILMMPIKIKIFQEKYLKLFTFNNNESLKEIKDKIEKNLKTIQELYDIKNLITEENGLNVEPFYKKNNKGGSMAYQLYEYYYNINNYIKEFEKIYFSLI